METQRKNAQKSQFEYLGEKLLARAPGKINLALLIADKRPDGYHNLETIMHKITFYDELVFEKAAGGKIELVCKGLWSPDGEDNLVYKAAKLFYAEAGIEPCVKITLTKNMPAGTGLGGASSDAATTILALNKIHNNSLTYEQMHKITAKLGSDVSFFLGGPMAYCSGRGEKVEELDKKFDFSLLLVLPSINVSTKTIYENFKVDLEQFSVLKTKIGKLLCENKIDLITKMLANMLAKTCFTVHNELALLKVKIEQMCGLPVGLSGSGCAMFIIIDNEDYQSADLIRQEIISKLDCNCIIVFNNHW